MTASQAVDLIYKQLGEMPLGCEKMAYGHQSITYDVALPTRNVIVRMNDSAQVFACTQNNIAELRKLGLPVPEMIASDLSITKFPFAYMILEKIPGRDLGNELAAMTPEQMTRLAEQIVRFQQLVGGLSEGAGYGFAGIGERAVHESWWEEVRPAGTSDEDVPESSRGLAAKVREQLSKHEEYFKSIPPTCFLDDVTVKNVIVKDGELKGIVDLDFVCYGDPLYWLALTQVGVVSDVGNDGLFYVKELRRLWQKDSVQERILDLYSASMALYFIRMYANKETAAWISRMEAATAGWLGAIEADKP